MAVPYRILVIHLMVFLPGLSWSQYATLKKRDLKVDTFDPRVNNTTTRCDLKTYRLNYFRYLQILEGNLYIGAMNCLLRFELDDLRYKDSESFKIDKSRRCTIQGKKNVPDCQNHIRTVLPRVNDPDKLLVCGTASYAPQKYTLDKSSLNVSDSGEAHKMCPFDPLDNVTSIYIEHGNPGNQAAYYIGLYADFIKNLPVIFRPSYTVNSTEYPELLPPSADVNWLNAPQFVGSFDVNSEENGNQVFFFFREIAQEYSESKTKIFSRVAKVCKNDLGGRSVSLKKWTSYQKARLNCSLPGYEPYYFDDIYDVYEMGDKFYALFHKHGADLSSSAICVYSKEEIFKVFKGSFQYQNQDKIWETLSAAENPNPRLDNCKLHDERAQVLDEINYAELKTYQLMDGNVNPVYGEPIFYKHGVQFLKIVVDDDNGNASNIYVATDTGDIYSIFVFYLLGNNVIVHLAAVLSPLDEPQPIWSMKLQSNSLYLGTDYVVAKVKIDVCSEYKMVDTCIHNIHCVWCVDDNMCKNRNQSCTTQTDYKKVYQKGMNSEDYDLAELIKDSFGNHSYYLNVLQTRLDALQGLYITLDINYRLQRSGPVVWKKDQKDILDNERYIFSSDGSLIIKNVSETDRGIFAAYDMVYRKNKTVAEYKIENVSTDEVTAWKQAFVEWSATYRSWRACSESFLETCDPN